MFISTSHFLSITPLKPFHPFCSKLHLFLKNKIKTTTLPICPCMWSQSCPWTHPQGEWASFPQQLSTASKFSLAGVAWRAPSLSVTEIWLQSIDLKCLNASKIWAIPSWSFQTTEGDASEGMNATLPAFFLPWWSPVSWLLSPWEWEMDGFRAQT